MSGIRIAAGVRNIGGKIKSSEGSSFSLPASVSAGVAYRFVNTEQHHIEAGADADIFIDGGASASVGVEYSYRNAAFARLGYNYASDKAPVPSFASVGIGFRIRSVRIDASYILPEKESPQKTHFLQESESGFRNESVNRIITKTPASGQPGDMFDKNTASDKSVRFRSRGFKTEYYSYLSSMAFIAIVKELFSTSILRNSFVAFLQ